MRKSLPLVLAGFVLAGCSSTPEPGSPAAYLASQQRQQEMRTATVAGTVEEAPSWYSSPPKDDTSLYGPGTATSVDLQLAIEKAVLAGKRDIADRLGGVVSAKLNEFMRESGSAEDAKAGTVTERVSKSVVTGVNLSGYSVTEKKSVALAGQYRAWVLVQYPLGEANRIMVDRIHHDEALNRSLRSSQAFKELERDIEASKPKSDPRGDVRVEAMK